MKNLPYSLIVVMLFALVFVACEEENKYIEEFIEVYQVDSASPETAKGQLQFMESYVEDTEGKIIAHGIYEKDNSVKGIERYIYKANEAHPSTSEYRDADDNLLSHYSLKYDDSGNKSRKVAFEGTTDEILRVETYEYDEQDNMTKKLVKTATDSLVRIYEFKYDEFGNETLLKVKDGLNKLLLTEEFVITKKRKDGKWVERYGYRNNQPKTFRKRYWKETTFSK